jgi:hypothetical protein
MTMMARIGQFSVRLRRGSALILTVVLTSLLAIVGVLFLMAARLDKMATSATTAGRELTFAVDTVLSEISEDLVEDVPGVGKNQEYYDFPDAENAWLADLEPYRAGNNRYGWRQISNVGGVLRRSTQNVLIGVVGERQPIDVSIPEPNADADGDGITDARWFLVPGATSSKGQPVYAAVRIIDNGGMLNINTGSMFAPEHPEEARVDGSALRQVNVLALAQAPGVAATLADAERLLAARADYQSPPMDANLTAYENVYEREVAWRYLDVRRNPDPNTFASCTPFDTSDELELRYRFLLNHALENQGSLRQEGIATRVENWGWFSSWNRTIHTPVSRPGDLPSWFGRAAADELAPTGGLDPNYAYRHVTTTYNMDRILTPEPVPTTAGVPLRKMLNVNTARDEYALRDAILPALRSGSQAGSLATQQAGSLATQIAANLRDYIDDDDKVTVMAGVETSPYYGFERPCVYLSEVACMQVRNINTGTLHTSYAVELCKPYFEDADPGWNLNTSDEWQLVIKPSSGDEVIYPLVWRGHGTRRFQVLLTEDAGAPLRGSVVFNDPEEPADPMPLYRYRRADYDNQPQDTSGLSFQSGDTIRLERRAGVSHWMPVDTVSVPQGLVVPDGQVRSIQRDVTRYRCLWRRWTPAPVASVNLGHANGQYVDTSVPQMQAHPANRTLTNIGELGMVLARNAYSLPEGTPPGDVLVNLCDPIYSGLFNYLTVIDPAEHGWPAEETRVMGRVNINTAPSFVLAQLPWMQYMASDPSMIPTEGQLLLRARGIVARRSTGPGVPYRSIGDLMQVSQMLSLGSDGADNLHSVAPGRGPDLTDDTARDDFEERDLIFTRISNLVTVRSDVFTAYILVRLGTNGPQKRVVAVLDRSHVNAPRDKVRIVAQQLVPDPR